MKMVSNQKAQNGMTLEELRKYYSIKEQRKRARQANSKLSDCDKDILRYLKKIGGMFYGSQKEMAKAIGYSRQNLNVRINLLAEKNKVLILKSKIDKKKKRVLLVEEVANG